jgi:hypothetical protein
MIARMIRSLVLPIALLALAASCGPLLAQTASDDAAEAAQLVAARADSAFEQVDPDAATGTAAQEPPALTPALSHADLPPLADYDDAVTYAAT